MIYKALLCDVDGTLIPNKLEGLPSEKVIEAIEKAGMKLHVGIATARPATVLQDLFSVLPLSGPSVINGGAQVVDLPSQRIAWERLMEEKDIENVAHILQKYTRNFIIFDENRDYTFDSSYKPHKPIQVYVNALEPEIAEKIVDELSSFPTISCHAVYSWVKGKNDIVINHAEATKQHGVFEVAKILGIKSHEIIGIGDGYNDFPLLMACGLKVAMGNAPKELKEIADYVAPTVDNDGVVDVIEKFILS